MTSFGSPITIVGRGIAGQALAYELIRKGRRIVMVGPKEMPGSASACAVGVSAMKGLLLPREPLFRLKFEGHVSFPAWLKRLESDCGRKIPLHQGAVFEPYADLQGYQRIRNRAFGRIYGGLLQVDDRTDCPGGGQAFHYPHDYWFDPSRLLAALDDFNRRHAEGVLDDFIVSAIRPSSVTSFSCDGSGFELVNQDGRRLECHSVVICAGYKGLEILKKSNIFDFAQKMSLGHSLIGDAPKNVHFLTNHSRIFGVTSLNLYDGKIRFGSSTFGLEEGTDDDLERLVGQDRMELQDLYRRRLAELPQTAGQFSACQQPKLLLGIRSQLRDRMPGVGAVPVAGKAGKAKLLVVSGLFKSGFSLAPLIAKSLAAAYFPKQSGKGAEDPDELLLRVCAFQDGTSR